jgi:hypothetical protein
VGDLLFLNMFYKNGYVNININVETIKILVFRLMMVPLSLSLSLTLSLSLSVCVWWEKAMSSKVKNKSLPKSFFRNYLNWCGCSVLLSWIEYILLQLLWLIKIYVFFIWRQDSLWSNSSRWFCLFIFEIWLSPWLEYKLLRL